MTNFPYTRDVPDAPNNPSNDQPKMEENTNSTDSLLNVDHYSFNLTNGGKHRQVEIPVTLAGGDFPATPGQGTMYAKVSGIGVDAQMFWRFAGATIPLQITNNNIAPVPVLTNPDSFAGIIPLMGGQILQYGTGLTDLSGTVTVKFANGGFFAAGAPTNPYIVLLGATATGGIISFSSGLTSTKFVLNSGPNQTVYWAAIGPYN